MSVCIWFLGVRGSGTRCSEARAIKATPAKVFSYVNKQCAICFELAAMDTQKRYRKPAKRQICTQTLINQGSAHISTQA